MTRRIGDPRHPGHRRARRLAVEARAQLALGLFHGARYAESEVELTRVLAQTPSHPGLRCARARIYLRSGQVRQAIGDLGCAIERRPIDPEPYLALAVCLGLERELPAARAALDRALQLAGRWAASYASTAGAGMARTSRREAVPPAGGSARPREEDGVVRAHTAEVKRRPDYADLRVRLAARLLEIGEARRAQAELRRALRINPGYLEARLLLARSWIEMNEARRAIPLLERMIHAWPDYPDLHFWLGLARFREGQAGLAVPPLERAVALNRGFARANRLLGLVHHALGRTDRALRLIQRGLARDRETAGLAGSISVGGREADGDAEELGLLRAIALKPDYPDLHVELARRRRASGDLEAARDSCRLALGLESRYSAAALELARLEIAMGRAAAAEKLLLPLVVSRPRWADARALLGRAYRMFGEPLRAEASLREALEINPGYQEAREDLEWALRARVPGRPRESPSDAAPQAHPGGCLPFAPEEEERLREVMGAVL